MRLKDEHFDDIPEIMKKSSFEFFCMTCPYCNNLGIISIAKTQTEDTLDPFTCVYCGDTNPHDKLIRGLEKVNMIYQQAKEHNDYTSADPDDLFDHYCIERVLIEQCVTLLATSTEIFLKDVYCLLLNIRFVRYEKSLFQRFHSDVRNDFLNIGKAKQMFKKDLDIDLDNEIGKDTLAQMNLLILKRNVIVHNLGRADSIFLSQSGVACKLRQPIPITFKEIEELIAAIEKIGATLETILANEMKEYRSERLKLYFAHPFYIP